MTQAFQSFDEFLAIKSPWSTRNGFVSTQGIYLFVRRSVRLLRGELVSAFDIATMSTEEGWDPNKPMQGARALRRYFSLLRVAEETAARHELLMVYIENVMNDKWLPFYFKLGYKPYNSPDEIVVCLYKELSVQAET